MSVPANDLASHPDMRLEGDEAGEERPAKRHKPLVSKVRSCAECRRLKLKCDRSIPCANCTRRGTATICPEGSLKTARGRRLILDSSEPLHDRIALLEEALRSATAAADKVHPLLEDTLYPDSTDDASPIDVPTQTSRRVPSVKSPNVPERSPIVSQGRQGVIAVKSKSKDVESRSEKEAGQYGHLNFNPAQPGASRYYGDASSLFLIDPSSTKSPDSHSQGLSFRPGWISSFIFQQDSALHFSHTLCDLQSQRPNFDEARRLADSYFDSSAWGTLIINRTEFDRDIFYHTYGDKPPGAQRLALFYLVLAVGALFDPTLPFGAAANPYARDLFALGRACLALDSSNSIHYVQALHVMVNWLSNSGAVVSSNQCTWPLIGLAMRVIQAIGLHRDGAHYGFTPDEVQDRRRIFWEMYSYDVSQSIVTGRPRMMGDSAFDVQFPATPEGEDCYHETRYRLATQLSKINDQQSKLGPASYDVILQIARDIRKFERDVPTQLQGDIDISPEVTSFPAKTQRRRNVQKIAIRFQTTISYLILHRGWFAQALLDTPEEPLHSKYSASFAGCIEACKSILDLVRQLKAYEPNICERRWFFHFHAFSACVCVAAAVIRAPLSVLAQPALQSLQSGIKLFEGSQRDEEMTCLRRLLQRARHSMDEVGADGAVIPDDEDLKLLGRGPIKQHLPASLTSRNDLGPPLSSGIQMARAVPETATDHIFSPFASSFEGHSLPSQIDDPIDPAFMSTSFPDFELGHPNNIDTALNVGNAQYPSSDVPSNGQWNRTLNGLNWADQEGAIPQFDFDAFLANFGITKDTANPFQSNGEATLFSNDNSPIM